MVLSDSAGDGRLDDEEDDTEEVLRQGSRWVGNKAGLWTLLKDG